ncbi:M48 family metallopeptidase [Hymenobacter terrenus]|uniref:M48 family metallopeptidase n=1 Tax=Hymenobacter terrenus TaxID=1629124 RepID=UPI00061A05E9|nr:M48 family metallopeptidase [Hymenobacter terrenus]
MRQPFLTLLAAAVLTAASSPAFAQFKLNTSSLGAGVKAVKAATLSDEQVVAETKQFVTWSDTNNPVAPASSPLTKRLEKITANLKMYEGLSLNYKVYEVRDINAFACADGSVRVCAGLMQAMTDDEVLGVIGHEIGHVKNHDSKDAMKTALLTSAAKEGASSQGGTAGALSNSRLGAVGQALTTATFSRSQESAADAFGYELLKKQGKNPYALASAFGKLVAAEQAGGAKSDKMQQLFSSHPDTEKRMKTIEDKAAKDGFKKV